MDVIIAAEQRPEAPSPLGRLVAAVIGGTQ